MAAFESLSRAVSGYPGRKNLIWLSTSFPVQIEPDTSRTRNLGATPPIFRSELAAAGALLAKSRIAVYPVDVRGLQGRGVDISNSATEAGNWTMSANSQNYGDLLATQASTYSDERYTMKEVAEQTGGEAFLGTNDLKRAMQRSMEDGSTYYTLAYTPDKVDPADGVPSHRGESRPSRRQAGLPSRLLFLTPAEASPRHRSRRAARRAAARNAAIDHALYYRLGAAARRRTQRRPHPLHRQSEWCDLY